MNFIQIPRNASRSVAKALEIKHDHKSVKKVGTPAFAIIREPAERLQSWFNYHKDLDLAYQYPKHFEDWVLTGKHHWTWELGYSGVGSPLNQWEFFEIDGRNQCLLVPYLNLDAVGLNVRLPRIGRTLHSRISGQLRDKINEMYKKDYEYYVLAKQRGAIYP